MRNSAIRALSVLFLVGALALPGWGFNGDKNKGDNPQARLEKSSEILRAMTSPQAEAGIPDEVLNNANCIAIVPGMVKGAMIVGARHGEGVATCRTQSGWSAPAFFKLTGASIGPQIGGQKTDLIMMVMNEDGMRQLMSGKLKLGADASVAAGPVGRDVSASAGWKAAILTYSRTEGAFVGADIGGSVVQEDDDAMRAFYGKDTDFNQALAGKVTPPPAARSFLNAVQQAYETARAR
jgi:lipid-binding SYLF domain-containing protein